MINSSHSWECDKNHVKVTKNDTNSIYPFFCLSDVGETMWLAVWNDAAMDATGLLSRSQKLAGTIEQVTLLIQSISQHSSDASSIFHVKKENAVTVSGCAQVVRPKCLKMQALTNLATYLFYYILFYSITYLPV